MSLFPETLLRTWAALLGGPHICISKVQLYIYFWIKTNKINVVINCDIPRSKNTQFISLLWRTRHQTALCSLRRTKLPPILNINANNKPLFPPASFVTHLNCCYSPVAQCFRKKKRGLLKGDSSLCTTPRQAGVRNGCNTGAPREKISLYARTNGQQCWKWLPVPRCEEIMIGALWER